MCSITGSTLHFVSNTCCCHHFCGDFSSNFFVCVRRSCAATYWYFSRWSAVSSLRVFEGYASKTKYCSLVTLLLSRMPSFSPLFSLCSFLRCSCCHFLLPAFFSSILIGGLFFSVCRKRFFSIVDISYICGQPDTARAHVGCFSLKNNRYLLCWGDSSTEKIRRT